LCWSWNKSVMNQLSHRAGINAIAAFPAKCSGTFFREICKIYICTLSFRIFDWLDVCQGYLA
jgi:hypothetical protein